MAQRYTNIGVKDVLLNGGSIDTNSEHSTMGTAVRFCTNSDYIDVLSLGFEFYPSEIWVRYDEYYFGNAEGSIFVQFDDNEKGTGSSTASYFYIYLDGKETYSGVQRGYITNAINTGVYHISPDTFEAYVNGELKLQRTGLSLGEKITKIRLRTGNSPWSNIIIADYDCSGESLGVMTAETLADTRRAVSNIVTATGDTARRLVLGFTVNGDTRRELSSSVISAGILADTARSITNAATISGDTRRELSDGDISVTVQADTRRFIKPLFHAIAFSGAYRSLSNTVSLSSDTRRVMIETIYTDVAADTSRVLANKVSVNADTKIRVPRIVRDYKKSGVQSVTLTLAEATLSDTLTLTSTAETNPGDAVCIELLGSRWSFVAEATHHEGIFHTVKDVMYDADKMLYTQFRFKSTRKGAKDLSRTIAAALGKEAVCLFDDFTPKNDYNNTDTTYQSILSGVFGWTKDVPRIQINIFIRYDKTDGKEKIYFMQRGHEVNIINLSDYKYDYPKIDRQIMRTTWTDNSPPPDGGTGAISAPIIQHHDKAPQKLSDGVTKEIEYEPAGSGSRTDNRVKYEWRENPDGTNTQTDYEYMDTGHDYLLTKKVETTKFPTGEVYKIRTTYYTYQNGWRHMTVIEDDKTVEESEEAYSGVDFEPSVQSASESWRGRPGDMGNEFYDEQTELAHGGKWVGPKTNAGNSYLKNLNCPVEDETTIRKYLSEIQWMDRKTEETARLSITGPVVFDSATGNLDTLKTEPGYIFDFFSRYRMDGKEYYLVSNVVSLTPRSLRQDLTLVRWY